MKRTTLIITAMISVAAANAQMLIMPDSTNNVLVGFDPFDGHVVNSNMFGLAGGTPIHAMQVGNEIWVSEQLGDRVSRWSMTGTSLGAVTPMMDNVRGMELIGNTVYVSNAGTGNSAPGPSLRMFDMTGADLGSILTPTTSPAPFSVLDHQGGMLVGSSSPDDDIHRFTYAGSSLGTFHNSGSINFVEELQHATNGDVLAGVFSSNVVATLDATTGAINSSFSASGARGVWQLGNGNILWSNGSGAWVHNVATGGESQIYQGGGRYFDMLAPVPEPATMLAMFAGVSALAMRRRKKK